MVFQPEEGGGEFGVDVQELLLAAFVGDLVAAEPGHGVKVSVDD